MEKRAGRSKEPNLPFIGEQEVIVSPFSKHSESYDENDKKPAAAGSKDNNDDDLDVDSSPLWQQAEDQGWELTWPIWHMLPRRERKELALRHGYKTIGEFEEYMSLQQAEQQSSQATGKTTRTSSSPYANALIYPESSKATVGDSF